MKYLLDTNICITVLRGFFNYEEILEKIVQEVCYISEITLYELKEGEDLARRKQIGFKNQGLRKLCALVHVLPITDVIDFAADEKARLQLAGTPLDDDFDLLIGCTSVIHGMTMVTENIRHFKNISGIKLENWVKRFNGTSII